MNNVTIRHSIFGAVLMIGLGLCAIATPLTSLGVVTVLAWVLMFSGVADLFSVLQSDDTTRLMLALAARRRQKQFA